MDRQDYFVLVWSTKGQWDFKEGSFDLDNILNWIDTERASARAYEIAIYPQALPEVLRLLKDETRNGRHSVSEIYEKENKDWFKKSFGLCFESYCTLRRVEEHLPIEPVDFKWKPLMNEAEIQTLEKYWALMKDADNNLDLPTIPIITVSFDNFKAGECVISGTGGGRKLTPREVKDLEKNHKEQIKKFGRYRYKVGGITFIQMKELLKKKPEIITDISKILVDWETYKEKNKPDKYLQWAVEKIRIAERPIEWKEDVKHDNVFPTGREVIQAESDETCVAEKTNGNTDNKVPIDGWSEYLHRDDPMTNDDKNMIEEMKRDLYQLTTSQSITASWEKPKKAFACKSNIEAGCIFFSAHGDYVFGRDKQGSWWARKKSANAPFWAWSATLREKMRKTTVET